MPFDPAPLEFHPLSRSRAWPGELQNGEFKTDVFWCTLGRPGTGERKEEPARLLQGASLHRGQGGGRGLAREEDVPRSPPTPPAKRLRWEYVPGEGPHVTGSREVTGKGPRGCPAAIAAAGCVRGVKCEAADPRQQLSLALPSAGKDFAWWAARHGDSPVCVASGAAGQPLERGTARKKSFPKCSCFLSQPASCASPPSYPQLITSCAVHLSFDFVASVMEKSPGSDKLPHSKAEVLFNMQIKIIYTEDACKWFSTSTAENPSGLGLVLRATQLVPELWNSTRSHGVRQEVDTNVSNGRKQQTEQ